MGVLSQTAALVVQVQWRSFAAKKKAEETKLRRKEQAATTIQSMVRMVQAKKKLKSKRRLSKRTATERRSLVNVKRNHGEHFVVEQFLGFGCCPGGQWTGAKPDKKK